MIQSPTITMTVTRRCVWTSGLKPMRVWSQSRTVAKASAPSTFMPPMVQLHILRDLAVIFAGSLLVILVFYRLKLPALPGFIVAGILLGPNALGLVSDPHDVEGLAEVGVILLLFTIGIEFSLSRLKEMGRQVLAGGFSQMGFTVLATLAVGLGFLGSWRVALFLAFLIALSSTAIVLKVLTDTSEIDAPHGRLATGVLIFQDLCVVPIMLVLPFLAGKAEGGVVGLLVALGKAALVVVGVIIAARTALGTAAAGASLALGAFLAGLIISESDYGYQALAELMPFRDIFISLFFVAVGMLVQLDTIKAHIGLTLMAVAVIMGGKTLSAAVGPALMGYSGRVALLAGVAVSQIGEFSFALAKEGRVAGLLPEPLYQQFLGVAVITMLVTPFLLQGGPALLDALESVVPLDRLLPGFRPRGLAPVHEQVKDHVVVAGYGLNGRNLTAALRSIHAPYLIVELNAQTIRKARAEGEPAFYGDATREEILRALGIDRARMLVIAISDPAATRRIVRVAREINPKLYIIARTRYVVEIPELTRLGANVVIPEEFETSIEIFARVLAHYNVPREEIERLVSEIRASHYQALRPGARPRLTLTGTLSRMPQMHVERIVLATNAPAVGLTVAETALRSKTGALILALRRGESDLATPDADFRLEAGDALVVVGQAQQIKSAYHLLTGSEPS